MSVPQLIADVNVSVRATLATSDSRPVRHPQAVKNAEKLIKMLGLHRPLHRYEDTHFDALHALGWFYWLRYVYPPGGDRGDLAKSITFFNPLVSAGLEGVPSEVEEVIRQVR